MTALGRRAPVLLALAAGLAAGGCKRHDQPSAAHVTQAEDVRDRAARLLPGPSTPGPDAFRARPLPVENPYRDDRVAIQEGRRLFHWMNCIDCHGEGGGSIGPALWDDQWRYGGRGIDIAESVLYGRPDGMPAFAGQLPEDEVWKLVAYVESLAPRGGPYHAGIK